MKVREEILIDDYEFTKTSFTNKYNSSWDMLHQIESTFGNYSNYNSNNYACEAFTQLVDFISANVFPTSGTWVGVSGVPSQEEGVVSLGKRLDYFLAAINDSNFYGELNTFLHEGYKLNVGLLDISWAGGISAKCIPLEDVYVAEDCAYSQRRVYHETMISEEELLERFEGDKVDNIVAMRAATNAEGFSSSMEVYKLVTGIVPTNNRFFGGSTKPGWKKVFMIVDGANWIVEDKHETAESLMFKTLPIQMFAPGTKKSLAKRGLSSAIILEDYDRKTGRYISKIVDPAMSVPMAAYESGNFNFGPGGMTPRENNEPKPETIVDTKPFDIGEYNFARHKEIIDKVYQTELLMRTKVANLSQFEYATNWLNALKTVEPLACDLIHRVSVQIIRRIDSLLRANVKEYRDLVDSVDEELKFTGFAEKIRGFEKAASAARIIQGLAPLAQIAPDIFDNINTDKLATDMAQSYGRHDLVVPPEVVVQQRAARAQQIQQQRELEQQNMQSETNANQAKAEENE